MFYEPVFEYGGVKLVARPDTDRYYISWSRPGRGRTRRRSTGTNDLDQAKRRLIAFVGEREQEDGPPPPNRVALLNVVADYVETLADRSSGWCGRKTLACLTEFCEREDIVWVSEFTPLMQDRFIAWRRNQIREGGFACSNATLQRNLGIIKAALRRHWQNGLLSHVPPIRSLPQPPARQRFLNRHEVQWLLEACTEPHLKLFVMLALHTLQRPTAILELTVNGVDLVGNRIDFNVAKRTQTNKRRAVVPISQTLRSYLVDAIHSSVSGFVVEWDGRPIKSVRTAFNKARARAGFGPDVTPYTLRHTGATWLAGRGVPLRQIAGMLGHSDTRTTERHYAKHAPDFLQVATNALDGLFPM